MKPNYRKFKGEDENEPKPRRKERVRYEDYEEITEPKEKAQSLPDKKAEPQPTIIIQNSPPVISKEGTNNGEI